MPPKRMRDEAGVLETRESRLKKDKAVLVRIVKLKRSLETLKRMHEKYYIENAAEELVQQSFQVNELMQKCVDDEANGKAVDHQDLVAVGKYFTTFRKVMIKAAAVDTALQQLSAEADAEAKAEAEVRSFFNNYKCK